MIFAQQFLHSLFFLGKWYLICVAIFLPLAYFFPHKASQTFFRQDMLTDTLYWFFGLALYGMIYKSFIIIFTQVYSIYPIKLFHISLMHYPLWAQIIILLLVTDVLQYWMHRLFHHTRLWAFHAIHHSATEIDWLSAARFHPVNFFLNITMIDIFVYLLGFNPVIYTILLPFNMIYPSFVHANLNWNLGFLRYFVASPIFHRWHHTDLQLGGNKNFAPTFPFIDLLFGTYYESKTKIPTQFGLSDHKIPTSIMGQLVYPLYQQK